MVRLRLEQRGLRLIDMNKLVKKSNIKNLDAMIELVAELFGLSTKEILSPIQIQDAVEARAVLYVYLHQQGYSRRLICRAFSKDYGTITNGINMLSVYLDSNTILQTRFQKFIKGMQKYD